MHKSNLSKTARWLAAASIAVAGVGLTARGSQAAQTLLTYVQVSNANCNTDASGNYLAALAFGLDSGGTTRCEVGESAEVVGSSGVGSTAQTTCTYGSLGSGGPVVTHVSFVASFSQSGGNYLTAFCISSPAAFTTSVSCTGTAPAHGSCPSGNTVTATSYGGNF
jgi:hypothetical protein